MDRVEYGNFHRRLPVRMVLRCVAHARMSSVRGWSLRVFCSLGVMVGLLGTGEAQAAPVSAIGYVYDADGQLRAVSDPASNTAVFNWDAVGNLVSVSRAATSALSVSQVWPARGAAGDTVSISGTGFSTTPASNTVKFNGTTATVTAATARLLTVKVPAGATTGTVSVTAPSGGPVSSAQTFTVGGSLAPQITSVSTALSSAGSTVTISGSNFLTSSAGESVRVGQSLAEITSSTASSIQFKVPYVTGGGAISVATAQGRVAGPDLFIPPPPLATSAVGPKVRLTLGTGKLVSFPTAGKQGLALVDGQAGQQISIKLSATTVPSGYATVYAPDGTTVVAQGYFALPDGGIVDTFTLPSTGTYTVVVDPMNQTGNVTLTAYDVHHVTGTLVPSSGGDVQVASLGTPGQNARYAVSATVGQRVAVKMTGSTIGYYTMRWLNPDGSELTSNTGYSTGDSLFEQAVLPTAGTYTLVVDPSDARTGSVTVTAYDTPDVTGTIAPSSSGDAKVVTIGTPAQNARFTFSGTSGQDVYFTLSDSTIADGWATVFAPDGSQLTQTYFSSSAGPPSDTITLPSTGTYTVLVDPSDIDVGHVTLTGYLTTMGFARLQASPLDRALANGSKDPAPSRASSQRRRSRPPVLEYKSLHGYLHGSSRANSAVTASLWRTPAAGSVFWRPSTRNRRALDWQTDRRATPWSSLALLHAPAGQTALAGRALRIDGLPLSGVRVWLEGSSVIAHTGKDGRFLLPTASAGHRVLVVDGAPAARGGQRFGTFEVGVDLVAHRTTDLDYTLWMTALDPAGDHRIASPTGHETVITTPRIPGLEVRLPAGTVIRDAGGKVVRDLNITPIAVDRPPFPLPAHVEVPLYFTVQPGRAYLSKGAQIIYPNYSQLPAGQRVDFWNYDADDRGWYVYGRGTVSADAKQVIPDAGVRVWEFTGAMISSTPTPPASGPTAGDGASDGDPVDLQSGLFTYHKTDLVLADTIPIVVDHVYRQSDSNSYSFGLGTASYYDMRLWSDDNYHVADLVLPTGGRVHYVRTSPGTGNVDAVYQASTTPGPFFGSVLKWDDPRDGWDLTLSDGTTYIFGDMAGLQAIRDRYGNQLTITRQSGQVGAITQITSPHGRWVRFTYNGSNQLTQARDNGGRSVGYTYDTSGRLKTVTDAAARVTTYGYNASDQLTSVKNGRNNTYVSVTYDANGRVATQTAGDGGTYGFAYTLDGSGHVTSTTVTDPRNIQRKVSFNTDGYPISDVHAFGDAKAQSTTLERQTGTDLLLSVTDPRARKTAYQYDASGNVTQVTELAGTASARSSTFTYDPYAQLGSMTDPLGHTTTYAHGSHGELSSMTDPLGHQTTFTHNLDGQLASVTNALSKTTSFGYFNGDLVSVTDPLGRISSQFEDGFGRLSSRSTPAGRRTGFEYNADNDLTKVTDPLAAATTYGYDGDGNLTSVTDARSNATTATYDAMDRLASVTDPLLHATQAVYDKDGNLTQLTDRRGKVSTFAYDVLNRGTQAKYGVVGATAQSTIDYTYDNGNRLTQVVDSADGTYTPSYDDFDRLTSVAGPLGTVGYGYDNGDRRTGMTVPGQSQVTYGYDNADRLTSLTRGTQSVTLAYDNADRPTSTTLVDGIAETGSYDDADQLTAITYTKGATTLGDLAYEYDADGHRSATWGSYARTGIPAAMASATYNVVNERTAQGATTLTYDNAGNLTSDGTSTYTWDARGQLSAIAGPTAASFAYDPFGRRTTRTVGAATTKFLYDGPNVTQEQVGGSATANLLSGGVDETFARTTTAGTDSYLSDVLGSTIALADASGAVQISYTYDPFGAVSSTGTANASPYRYAGREDDSTGLDYYRARYYSPTQARFISQDPAGMSGGGPNLYAYTGNDPTDMTDPTGMFGLGGLGMFISNSAAGALNTMTFGISNQIAGVSGKCAGPGYGFGSFAGAFAFGPIGEGAAAFEGATAAEGAAAEGGAIAKGSAGPSFIGFEEGAPVIVPKGAHGPLPTRSPGMQFEGGSGGHGLDPRVTGLRIMDGNGYHPPRLVYENRARQKVNPHTGRTISNSDPWAHMPW